jgi:hypothetical protein
MTNYMPITFSRRTLFHRVRARVRARGNVDFQM